MYSDVEVAESASEDFLSALALLRSSDEGSAERLRSMLDASIEKKFGTHFSRHAAKRSHDCSRVLTGIVSEFEDQIKLMESSRGDEDFRDRISSFSSGDSVVDCSSLSSSDICTTDDSLEDEEIPRISIPDETTGDGAVCKICSGDKLGPLILLECQECQDLYHPLCHQPPVVDVDVYDPRIVWRCERCIGTSDERAAPRIVARDDGLEASGEEAKTSGSRPGSEASSRSAEEKLGREERTEVSCLGRTRPRAENDGTSLKRVLGATRENSSISLRKRVGSKLGVTRASPAK